MTEDTRLHEESIAARWRAAYDSDDLLTVIAALYAQEINVGLQTFWDGGLDVWIGDEMNGRKVTENFRPEDIGQVAQWLKLSAEQCYPVLRARRIGDLAYV